MTSRASNKGLPLKQSRNCDRLCLYAKPKLNSANNDDGNPGGATASRSADRASAPSGAAAGRFRIEHEWPEDHDRCPKLAKHSLSQTTRRWNPNRPASIHKTTGRRRLLKRNGTWLHIRTYGRVENMDKSQPQNTETDNTKRTLRARHK